jgi:hypothetical protein
MTILSGLILDPLHCVVKFCNNMSSHHSLGVSRESPSTKAEKHATLGNGRNCLCVKFCEHQVSSQYHGTQVNS